MKMFNRDHFQKKLAKLVNTPKARRFGDARDNPDFSGSRSTMPARQRAGQTYAGGRHLRRALKRLESNRKGILEARAIAGKDGKVMKSDMALRMPGAMHP